MTVSKLTVLHDCFGQLAGALRRLLHKPVSVLLLAMLASFLVGVFLQPHAFALTGALGFAVVLGVCWPWLSLRGLHATISYDRSRAIESESVEVCLALRNRLPWPAWGLILRQGNQAPTADECSDGMVATVSWVPPRRTARCRAPFVPSRRGIYPLTIPKITTGFPLGLWESTRPVAVETRLTVWPRTFPAGPVPIGSGDQRLEGSVSRNKVGSNGDILGVRPYRRGDSPRRIHWSQSARHDRLIVCELQANAQPVIQLILDSDPKNHSGAGADSSREWAIRILASLAQSWLEAGVQIAAICDGQVLPAASGRRQLERLLDGLAAVPDASSLTLGETLRHSACCSFQDGLQVIVTTDKAIQREGMPPCHERQRWVVLRAGAFRGPDQRALPESEVRERADGPLAAAAPVLPVEPWLWVDRVDRIPALLRGGWKEARHGT